MNLFHRIGHAGLLQIDPEIAHSLSIRALKLGLGPRVSAIKDPRLQTIIAGMRLPNPVGLAAGYDKNGEVCEALLTLGFGFVEAGTVTPKPQAGNPRPRIFRLRKQRAIINRLGFNNQGHEAVLARLRAVEQHAGIVGINIGANKDSADFISDYEKGIETFGTLARYFTANISSPNTPGLRDLHSKDRLPRLLERLVTAREQILSENRPRPPVFLKIAPDLESPELDSIAASVSDSGIDGLIISNTTLARDGLDSQEFAVQAGGLSGRPLFARSTRTLAQMRERVGPDFPIIGVGGVHNTQTALEKIEAGADAVQLYTGLVYEGPGLANEINQGLVAHLARTGKSHISEIKGVKTRQWASGRTGDIDQ